MWIEKFRRESNGKGEMFWEPGLPHLVVLTRSTELDFNWSWFQLRCMQVGGNASAVSTWGQNMSTLSRDCNPTIASHTWFNLMICVSFSVSALTFPWQIGFFSQHGCTASAANAKYNSRAAQLYREKIKTLATQATRRHGTEVMQTFAGCSTAE